MKLLITLVFFSLPPPVDCLAGSETLYIFLCFVLHVHTRDCFGKLFFGFYTARVLESEADHNSHTTPTTHDWELKSKRARREHWAGGRKKRPNIIIVFSISALIFFWSLQNVMRARARCFLGEIHKISIKILSHSSSEERAHDTQADDSSSRSSSRYSFIIHQRVEEKTFLLPSFLLLLIIPNILRVSFHSRHQPQHIIFASTHISTMRNYPTLRTTRSFLIFYSMLFFFFLVEASACKVIYCLPLFLDEICVRFCLFCSLHTQISSHLSIIILIPDDYSRLPLAPSRRC